jgi:hypothetical protein
VPGRQRGCWIWRPPHEEPCISWADDSAWAAAQFGGFSDVGRRRVGPVLASTSMAQPWSGNLGQFVSVRSHECEVAASAGIGLHGLDVLRDVKVEGYRQRSLRCREAIEMVPGGRLASCPVTWRAGRAFGVVGSSGPILWLNSSGSIPGSSTKKLVRATGSGHFFRWPIRLYSWRSNVWVPSLAKGRLLARDRYVEVERRERPAVRAIGRGRPTASPPDAWGPASPS